MRIAAALVAAWIAACGPTEAPGPQPPSCARAYDQVTASLAELHRAAGRATPALPDRPAWISACEGLHLSDEALRCLEPAHATAEVAACTAALSEVDRGPLDQPFLDTMLPKQEDRP